MIPGPQERIDIRRTQERFAAVLWRHPGDPHAPPGRPRARWILSLTIAGCWHSASSCFRSPFSNVSFRHQHSSPEDWHL